MSKYTEQADKFCDKYGIKITWELISHFEDKRLRHAKVIIHKPSNQSRYFPLYRDKSLVTIERNGKKETFEFTGSAYIKDPWVTRNGNHKRPKGDNYSILACLQKSDPGTLEEFCSEFGYDTDSRKALEIYLAVQQEFKKVNRLFHDVMDELSEIN